MNNKVLIIFTHPRFERSINNSILVQSVPKLPDITFHDLYEKYPDFNIDIASEKSLLSDHNIIIWQHPFYWYSSPPLLKQWIDLVLEFGWAYGPGGNYLQGKIVFNSITTGGNRSAYSKEGHNRFTIKELLAPFEQTAFLCKMNYLPPFVVHGTHRISTQEKDLMAQKYHKILERFVTNDFSVEDVKKYSCLNDWMDSENSKKTIV